MGVHNDALGIAAIQVLAEHGSRGFTHRAVDKRAGLPEGTASRYARTRTALLALATEAMFADDSRQAARALTDGGVGITTPEDVTDALVRVTKVLLTAPGSYRARLELQLEAMRTPELRRHFQRARAAFVDALAAVLRDVDDQHPHDHADALVAVVDGVLHRQLILNERPLTDRRLRALLRFRPDS